MKYIKLQGKEVKLLLDLSKQIEIEYMESMLEMHKLDAQYFVESELFKVNQKYLLTEAEAANTQTSQKSEGIIDKIFNLISQILNGIKNTFMNIFGITPAMDVNEYCGQNANKKINCEKDPSKVADFFDGMISKGHNLVHRLINNEKVSDQEFDDYTMNPSGSIEKGLKVIGGSVITMAAGAGVAAMVSGRIGKQSDEVKQLNEETKKYMKDHKAEMNQNVGDKVEKVLKTMHNAISESNKFFSAFGRRIADGAGKIRDKKNGKITDPEEVKANKQRLDGASETGIEEQYKKSVDFFLRNDGSKYSKWDSTIETDLIKSVGCSDNQKNYVLGYAKKKWEEQHK